MHSRSRLSAHPLLPGRHRRRRHARCAAVAGLVALLGCSSCKNEWRRVDERTQAVQGVPGGVPAVTPALARDVPYALQVTILADGDTPGATFLDVQPVLAANCFGCHYAGQPLDLSASPLTSRFATPKELVTEMLRRVTSRDAGQMPPPPAAALPGGDIAKIKAWLGGGLLAAPAPGPAAASALARGLTVLLRERLAGQQGWTEVTLPWNGTGVYAGVFPKLPAGGAFELEVHVLGQDGREVGAQSYAARPLASAVPVTLAATVAEAALRAHAVDHTPPAPGGGGAVTAVDVGMQALSVSFAPATDDVSTLDQLTYAVFVSPRDDIASAADAAANGRQVRDFAAYQVPIVVAQLAPGTDYYVTVLVRDAAGNVGVYKTLQQATALDTVPPAPPAAAVLTVSRVTETAATLAWGAASDNLTPPAQLTYQVYSSSDDNLGTLAAVRANGLPVGPPAAAATAATLLGMAPDATYYLAVVVTDAAGNQAAYAPARLHTAPAGPGPVGAPAFAAECAARMGTLKPFSCLDGQMPPLTVDGVELAPNLTPAQAAAFRFSNVLGRQQVCDRPPLLALSGQGHCIPYSRFGRLPAYDPAGRERADVDTMFGCRRYLGRAGPATWQGQTYDASAYPGFEDIAIIQHNRVTGETCFFQMLQPDLSAVDGRRVPPPTEAALPADAPAYAVAASRFWLDPQTTAARGCNNCHDSDPWVHSPYIDQLRAPDGGPYVPPGGKGQRYSVVGSRGFNAWARSVDVASSAPADPAAKSCNTCHNIGSLYTCAFWARQAVGLAQPANLSATGGRWPLDHWMPPAGSGVKTAADWQASGYPQAAQRLLACCDNPAGPGCVTTPIMRPPPPYLAN